MNEDDLTEAQQQFTEWLETLRVAVMESVGGVTLRGARAVPVGSTASGTTRPANTPTALTGFALRNTSDVDPATVILRDGSDSNGEVLVPITLAAGESAREWFGPAGINVAAGLFVDVTDGDVDGCVYLRGPQ